MDKECECLNLRFNWIRPAYNKGFSAMLAEEYILIDISLSSPSWCDFSSQRQLKLIQHKQLYLSLVTGLDVTQNISTAESPGRCTKLRDPSL
jgi:hypothetical protein